MMNETSKIDGLNFYGFCKNEETFNSYNVKKDTIVLFKSFGNERTEISGKISLEGLYDFIRKYSSKKVMRMNDESFKIVWEDLNPGLIIVYDKKSKNAEIYRNIVKELGDKLYGRIKIIESGIYSIIEKQLMPQINLTLDDIPAVRLTNTSDIRRPVYKFKGAITVDNVIKFVEDWEKGKLYPIMKSEVIPSEREQEKNKIFKVVSDSFYQEILNVDKNFIVFLYNDIKDDLNDKGFKEIEKINQVIVDNNTLNIKVKVVQIDCSKNQVWDMKCNKFPCVYLMKNKEENIKEKIKFNESEIKYNSIAKFINNNLKVEIPLTEEKTGDL